ncbi:MAG: HEAT repeat domain-containing protein [Phycisphaerales bacterium]|nr:HEAT repeat domain-containing protein [Phycisphaerales bacterium]
MLAALIAAGGRGGIAAAQNSHSQPATHQNDSDQRRIADLASIIEGQNTPAARETGARELLRDGSPAAVQRLAAMLSGKNNPARIAIANVIAANGDGISADLLDALIQALAAPEAEVATAAANALSVGGEPAIRRLITYVQGDGNPSSARVMAIRALGLSTEYEAVRSLVSLLDSPRPDLSRAASDALELVAGARFGGDPKAAQTWWAENGADSPAEWQSRQLRRLAMDRRRIESAVQGLETRLAKALREAYVRVPEPERSGALQSYLTDPLPVTQKVGLELAQSDMAESRPLKPEVIATVRRLLTSEDATVREAAVQTLAALRDPVDAERLLERLTVERLDDVRRALLNGLGYLGSDVAADALMGQIPEFGESLISEAVTALGRMIERGVLDGENQARIASLLLDRYQATPRENAAVRERLLWALSRLRSNSTATVFVEALGGTDAAIVRQAAVRGIAALESPPSDGVAALQGAIADSDASVRRAAVEALGAMSLGDEQITALWSRLAIAQEPDEAVRDAAWRAVLRQVSSKTPAEIERRIDALPAGDANTVRRSIDLLNAAIAGLQDDPARRADAGRMRKRAALLRESAGQIDKAVEIYLQALEDFRATSSTALADSACDFLRMLLVNRRYDVQSGRALSGAATLNDLAAVVSREAAARLTDDAAAVELACGMIAAFREFPPSSLPADIEKSLDELAQRAEAHHAALDESRVERAVAALRVDAGDPGARDVLTSLGRRAVPGLCAQMEQTLAQNPSNQADERLLCDLLKAALPDWPGFAPESDAAAKQAALELARRSATATTPTTGPHRYLTRPRA